jgi:lipopolysaccharide export system protein LptA
MFVCVSVFFVDSIFGKIVITGDEMEVRKAGSIIISKGNSKATNNTDTITAYKMSYDTVRSILFASGSVKLFPKTEKGKFFKIYGNFAEYNMDSQKGEICGDYAIMEHYAPNLTSPLILSAKEIYIDIKEQTLSAYKKGEKRPVVKVDNAGRKELYEADEITFYNSYDKKKIVMNGSVVVKIKTREDKHNDVKNRKII